MKTVIFYLFVLFSVTAIPQTTILTIKKEVKFTGANSVDISVYDFLEPHVLIPVDLQNKILMTLDVDEVKSFDRSEVARMISPHSIEGYRFVLPNSIELSHLGSSLTKSVVKSTLKDKWQKKCLNCRITLNSVQIPEVPKGADVSNWKINLSSGLVSGRFTAELSLPNWESSKTLWVTGSVNIEKPVLTFSQSLPRGQVDLLQFVELKFRDIAEQEGSILDLANLKYRELKRSVSRGYPVKHKDLQTQVAFKKGDLVNVTYQGDAFSVSSRALASSQGRFGQRVWLKLLESSKKVSGVVQENGEVLLQ